MITVLTESPNPQAYWRVMKKRLKDEGNETVTNCNDLKSKVIVKFIHRFQKLITSIMNTSFKGDTYE